MYCTVDKCSVNCDKSKDNIFLHTLPRDEKLAAKWIHFCGKTTEIKPELVRVCARHFSKTDYHYNMVKRTKQLRKGAVPSLIKPSTISCMDEFQEVAMDDSLPIPVDDFPSKSASTYCPMPVVNESMLKKIRLAMAELSEVPQCPLLRQLFDDITHNRPYSHPSDTELHSIYNILQPNAFCSFQAFRYSNMDKVLEYYIFNYPVFAKQRQSLIVHQETGKEIGPLMDGWYKEYFCYVKVKLEQLPSTLANRQLCDSSTQTRYVEPPAASGFCVEVNGPPECMNGISISTNETDVIFRFEEESEWDMDESNLKALLNYPQISFEFKLNEDIWFKRTLSCEYERYIMKSFTPKAVAPKHRIRNVRKNDITSENVVYSHGFLSAFLKTLSELIANTSDKVSELRKKELLSVINEFLADVCEINLYNRLIMPTNACISYVIGDCEYLRHKSNAENTVNYVEFITPVATVLLLCFAPCPKATGDLCFKRLKYFADNMNEFETLLTGNGLLSFGCTQCKIHFATSTALFQHCRSKHRRLSPMTCERCKMPLDVSLLAAERWSHTC